MTSPERLLTNALWPFLCENSNLEYSFVMQRLWTSKVIRGLIVMVLSLSGLVGMKVPATGAITLPPKGVSQELWGAFQDVVISNISGEDRNLRWTTSPLFYIAGNPTVEDNNTFRSTLVEIGKYCTKIKPFTTTTEPGEGALFHYVPVSKFKSIIPETPADARTSYSWSLYYLNRGLTKFTAVMSSEDTQASRDISTQINVYRAMGLRNYTKNQNARIFSWTFPSSGTITASELDKQIIRLYCSTYTKSWDTAQQTFDEINSAWTKKTNVAVMSLNLKVGEYKNQLDFNFDFDPSIALDNQVTAIGYNIMDTGGLIVKSGKIDISGNLFQTYKVSLNGIKDSSRYKIEAFPINASGTGSLTKGEGRAGSLPAPADTYESASDASAEVIDARKAASDAIDAGNEALALFGRYKEECSEVSTQFETEAEELYDTTSLNTYCEQLNELVSELDTKIGALDTNKATTTDQANELTDTANTYAEEADELVALIQDITDELSATEKQLLSIVKLLEPINLAETEIVEGWEALAERIALLPKTSQSTIKKSSSFKSALSVHTQVVKSIASRDVILEDLGSLEDPRKLSGFVSQLSLLKINPALVPAFKKSLKALNKGIPSKVCIKGSLTLLPSKSGKCPVGYEQTPTQ
jgi:hypothetical protein